MSGKRKRRYGLTGLPRVRNLEDLSVHTGLPVQRLWRLIYKDARAYVGFSIRKKAGGKRKIYSPNPFLRVAQKWILNNILNHLNSEPSCYGFEPGSKLRIHAE